MLSPVGSATTERVAPPIRATGIGRTFRGPPDVVALAPCSFEVAAGELVALTGPSGSGKSTLLSILGLLDSPTTGRYELGGVDVSGLDDGARTAVRRDHIGFVFQDFHLLGYRSAMENVTLPLLYQGIEPPARDARARSALERVGMIHRSDHLCGQLSGGECQRVAVARALVTEPSVILCDEPTGNLDTANSASIVELLVDLGADGRTIVIITHDPSVASRAARQLSLQDIADHR